MTRPSRRLAIRGGIALAVLLVAVVLIRTISSGGVLDSAADDGYLGLKLLLEERGATVDEVDGGDVDRAAAKDFDVVFVLRPQGVERRQLGEWHQYVAAGGRLVLGEPDRVRPDDGRTDLGETVDPGDCNIDGAQGLGPIHAGEATGHHVHDGERSCFGTADWAVVTSAVCRAGEQITLSSPTVFDNRTMGAPTDERLTPEVRRNAALATLLLVRGDRSRVGIVTGGVSTNFGDDGPASNEPKCGDTYSDDALWQDPNAGPGRPDGSGGSGGSGERPPGGDTPGGTSGGTSGERPSGGTPNGGSGGGTDRSDGNGESDGPSATRPPPTVFDFLSPGLKLALAQLLAMLVWYAWRRSRRRGVVVEDEMPVQLRSSRNVEAVGALRRRGGEVQRTAIELRSHTSRHLSKALGLGPDAPADDIAVALAPLTRLEPVVIRDLLAGPLPDTEEDLVSLGSRLHSLRELVDRPAVTGRVGATQPGAPL